jgi:RNA polymerase sigma-70 factor (ECF subfamily)
MSEQADNAPAGAVEFDYISGHPNLSLVWGKAQHARRRPAGIMVEQEKLDEWFRREVLPLEGPIIRFVRRNWRVEDDVMDLTHDIYELAYTGARSGLPASTRGYVLTIARNHLINKAKRAQIVSFELVADLETLDRGADLFGTERQLFARDALRHVQAGLEKLSPRVREVLWLRKVEGLDVAETAKRLGVGKDAVNHQLMMGMKALTDHMLGGAGKIFRPRYGAGRHGRKTQ